MKGLALQVSEPRYSMSVMTENNGVPERKQCFSCKCHVLIFVFTNFYIVQEPRFYAGFHSGFDLFLRFIS